MASKQRLKTPAVDAPQTRDQVAALIREIGDLTRSHGRAAAELNDQLAALTERYQPVLDAMSDDIGVKQRQVQAWCEAHRDELTGGKVKSANLVTGEVQWRQRPPSVRITGADSVIEALERLGLGRFVRIKREVNKEAILNEPDAVKGVAGIGLSQGVEDFVIIPFEAETAL